MSCGSCGVCVFRGACIDRCLQIALLKSPSPAVAAEAAGTVEQLAQSEKSKQVLLDPTVVTSLVALLHNDTPAQVPALAALSHLSASRMPPRTHTRIHTRSIP